MLETKPKTPNDITEREPSTWVAIDGMIVAGYFQADCYVCAGRIRDQDYPGCKTAFIVTPQFFPMCVQDFAKLNDDQKRRLLKEEGLAWMYPRLFR